jgi:hypothetical protein
MNKYKYLSVAALASLGMMMTGCSDFLEAENKSAGGQTADDTFSKDASSFLVSAYYNLRSIVGQVEIGDQGTDLFTNTRGKAAGEFNEHSITAENSTIKSYYSNAYQVINQANGVIYYAGADSENGCEARFVRDFAYYQLLQQFGSVPYITEYIASANRDYPRTPLDECYNTLIKDLEDLYNHSTTLANTDKTGRASKQAVAALLAKTYLAAAWDLDTEYKSEEAGTYTGPTNTERFKAAAQWAEKAINGVQLTMSYSDKWDFNNQYNDEVIFAYNYEREGVIGDATSLGHSLQNNYGGYYGDCKASGLKNVGSENAQSVKSMCLFEEGDARYEGTFMTTFYNSKYTDSTKKTSLWGTSGYYAYYNLSADALAEAQIALQFYPYYWTVAEAKADLANKTVNFKAVDLQSNTPVAAILDPDGVTKFTFDDDGNVKSTSTVTLTEYNNSTNNGVCVRKWDDPNSEQLTKTNTYRNIPLLQVNDMYLVAAEAYLMAGNENKSLEYLNAVRKRAGLADTSFDTYEPQYSTSSTWQVRPIDLILDERARELYAEQTRWIDLRRTKQLVRYNVEFNEYVSAASQMRNNSGEYKLLRPIPSLEISSNTGISAADQNPGY